MIDSQAVYLNQIETEVPENDEHAKFIALLPQIVRDERIEKIVTRLAHKCHIDHRYSVLKADPRGDRLDSEGHFKVGSFPSTQTRMRIYQDEALPLAIKPVARILEKTKPSEITHLIVTSCTGFYAPGLDLELQKHFGLRGDLERTIIGFMGCYAAFNGMRAASHIVRSQASAKVLLVNLELCSLHLQETNNPEKLLGFLQFADGCAASLISGEKRGFKLERFRTEVLSDDAELIQWRIGDQGFDMTLSTEVPMALARTLPSVLPKIMTPEERSEMRLWAIHPGGRSILDSVQSKLELTDDEMKYSREVLRSYGNMSSATIMFVLKALAEDSTRHGLGAAMAFGPGLTVESMIFRKEEMN